MELSYKLAVIGSKEAIMGFRMVGADIFPCADRHDLHDILFTLKNKKITVGNQQHREYAIIFVTEELAETISKDDYRKLTNEPLPAIIPIPSHQGSTGFGLNRIGQIVERAIGSNILNK